MLDFSTSTVTEAPRESLNRFFRLLCGSPVVESQVSDGILYWHSEIPHPWFNGVLLTRPPAGDEKQTIAHISVFFIARGVKVHTLWPGSADWIEEWSQRLLPVGYNLNLDPPGMSADLSLLPDSTPIPEGFTIRQVSDLEMLRAWMEVFIPGYGLPPHFAEPFYRVMASLGVDGALRSYLGYLNGKAVTASTLFLDEGIAGIYNVATLPEARGRGLGAAVTLQPLLDAHEMGCQLGALQSSELGFSVYLRLGFRKVCDVTHFSSPPG